MAQQKRRRREAHPAIRKGEEILIEKSQISDPKLDDDTQKILDSIVLSIRNCPPAKPRRKYQKGEAPEKDTSSNKSVTSSYGGSLSGSRTSSVACSYNNFLNKMNTISSISNSKSSNYGDNDSMVDFDRKSQVFYMNSQTQSELTRLVDENKSCCSSQQSNENHSNYQSPVTKDKLTTSITANLQQFFAKKPLKDPSQKPKISLQTTKKRIGQGMIPTTSSIKCIDLQSQQIVQVKIQQNDKKKAQLELIMRYDLKNSIKQQTNENMNHQSLTSEFSQGDNAEDKAVQINECLLNDIDVPLNECLTLPQEMQTRQEILKLSKSTNEEQK